MNSIHHSSALSVLSKTVDDSIDLIVIDPPFGTGKRQLLAHRKGAEVLSTMSYGDVASDWSEFISSHIREAKRVLKQSRTMYLHLDWRNVHIARFICDEVFGNDNFLNEVIWSYNFGGRGRDRFPAKHDNILVYTKERGAHIFNWDDVDRIVQSTRDAICGAFKGRGTSSDTGRTGSY